MPGRDRQAGHGKSHILMAIALLACEGGYLVRYARFVDMLTELARVPPTTQRL
jgi:DNA replication protein DnaC